MKELAFVYLCLLLITIAGCSTTRTYDLTSARDRETLSKTNPIQIETVEGEVVLVRNVRMDGDSLRFTFEERVVRDGETWRRIWSGPGTIAADSVRSVTHRKVNVWATALVVTPLAVLGLVILSGVVYCAISDDEFLCD